MGKKQFIIALMLFLIVVMTSCESYNKHDLGSKQSTIDTLFNGVNKNDDMVLDIGPVKGGTLRIFSTIPDTLNPIFSNNVYVNDFSNFIFESLVKIDKNQKPTPLLSDRWDISLDGLIWTFHIRDKVYWHNKNQLTANDVEYTMNMILNSGFKSSYAHNVQNITTFAAIDRENFRIVLKKPNSFTAELMTFPILLENHSLEQGINFSSKINKPIGTGPFEYSHVEENQRIILKSNSEWWGATNTDKDSEKDKDKKSLPYIDEINIELYDKSEKETGAFQTRDVDVSFNDTADYDKYYGRYDLTIKKYLGDKFEFISFNLNNSILTDRSVRQAISYSLNKENIIEKLLPGKGIAADIPVQPGTWLYDTNITSYSPNITKAMEILKEAGWKDQNNTMFKRINGVNTPLKLELLVNEDNELRLLIAHEIKEQLAKVGIEIQVKTELWEKILKSVDKGDYDMVMMGCVAPSIPDISFLYSNPYIPYYSLPESDRGKNIAGYNNPEVDNYLERIFAENDSERKKALFINMRNIITNDVPYLGLFFYNDALLLNRNISGDIEPHTWDKFSNIARWYLPEASRP